LRALNFLFYLQNNLYVLNYKFHTTRLVVLLLK